MFGDGTQSRSFTYVGDVVECLLKLVNEPKAVGQVFNIGNKEEVTILKLAEIVKSLTGSASPIEFVPYDKAYEEGFEDMPRRVPDLTKVQPARRLRAKSAAQRNHHQSHRLLPHRSGPDL